MNERAVMDGKRTRTKPGKTTVTWGSGQRWTVRETPEVERPRLCRAPPGVTGLRSVHFASRLLALALTVCGCSSRRSQRPVVAAPTVPPPRAEADPDALVRRAEELSERGGDPRTALDAAVLAADAVLASGAPEGPARRVLLEALARVLAPVATPLHGLSGRGEHLQGSADGRWTVAALGRAVTLWHDGSPDPSSTLSGLNAEVDWLGWRGVGNDARLLTIDRTHRLQVWEPRAGRLLATLGDPAHSIETVGDGSTSPDTIFTTTQDRRATLWEVSTSTAVTSVAAPSHPERWSVLPLYRTRKLLVHLQPQGAAPRRAPTVVDGVELETEAASGPQTLTVREGRAGRIAATLPLDGSFVASLAISHDETTIAAGTEQGQVKLWDARTGRLTRTLEGVGGRVAGVRFAPGDTRLVAWSSRAVRSWTVSDLHPDPPPAALDGEMLNVDFVGGDGRLVAVTSLGHGRLWDAASGETVRTLETPRAYSPPVLSVSDDGARFLLHPERGWTQVHDVRTGALVVRIVGPTSDARFCRGDGRLVTLEHSGGSVASLWDGATLRTRLVAPDPGGAPRLVGVGCTPDGLLALGATPRGAERLETSAPWVYREQGWLPRNRFVTDFAFDEDGRRAIIEGRENLNEHADLWDLEAGRSRVALNPRLTYGAHGIEHQPWIFQGGAQRGNACGDSPQGAADAGTGTYGSFQLEVAQDGRRALFRDAHGYTVRDRCTQAIIATVPNDPRGDLRSWRFSPGGTWLLAETPDSHQALWNASTGAPQGELEHAGEGWPGGLLAATFSRNDRWLLVSTTTDLTLWDPATRRLVATLHPRPTAGDAGTDASVASAPSWNAASARPDAIFSPQGDLVLTEGDDLTLWETSTGRRLGALSPGSPTRAADGGGLRGLLRARFSSDGSLVAAALEDGRIGLWDVRSRALVASLPSPVLGALVLGFYPDGEALLVLGIDGTLARLPVSLRAWLPPARETRTR